MRHTTFSLGCVENTLMACAAVEMGHHLGVPVLTPGLSTDAKHPGVQAGWEKGLKVFPVCSTGSDLISGGMGLIDTSRTLFVPQAVIDDEIVAWVRRMVAETEVSAETLAGAAIAEVGPGGNFLALRETRTRIRAGEHLVPAVASRLAYEAWEEAGVTEVDVARARVDEILRARAGREPDLSEDQLAELAAICGQREAASRGCARVVAATPCGRESVERALERPGFGEPVVAEVEEPACGLDPAVRPADVRLGVPPARLDDPELDDAIDAIAAAAPDEGGRPPQALVPRDGHGLGLMEAAGPPVFDIRAGPASSVAAGVAPRRGVAAVAALARGLARGGSATRHVVLQGVGPAGRQCGGCSVTRTYVRVNVGRKTGTLTPLVTRCTSSISVKSCRRVRSSPRRPESVLDRRAAATR